MIHPELPHNLDDEKAARFWSHVSKSDECWIWTGSRHPKGYGKLRVNNRSYQAHRIAYGLAFGQFDQSLQVLHRCDNPPCVRPDHLFLGTNQDNVADKMAKGRYRCLSGDDHPLRKHPERAARGETNGFSKLTWDQVCEIRRLYAAGGISQRELAQQFNVSQPNIGGIVRNEYWQQRYLP